MQNTTDTPSHLITLQYAYRPLFYAILLLIGVFDATACLVLSALQAIYFALPPRKVAG